MEICGLSREEVINGCKEHLLDPTLLKIRIEKLGWDKERSFSEPTEHMRKEWVNGAVAILNDQLGLSMRATGHNSSRIYIGSESRNKLFDIWSNMFIEYGIPDCMLYKLGLSDRGQLGIGLHNEGEGGVGIVEANRVDEVDGGYMVYAKAGHQFFVSC